MNRPAVHRAALLLAAAGAIAGCSHAPPKKDVFWPLPPAQPRIRFVDTFASAADLDRSGWARFRRTVGAASEGTSVRQPIGIVVSDDGKRVYVADGMYGAVLRADLDAKKLEPFAPKAALGSAAGVALDADENVYVTDPKKREIAVVTRAGERLRQIGAGDLVRPLGLAIDRQHRLLYVVDTGNQKDEGHRVLVYDLEGTFRRELGPAGERPGRGVLEGQFQFPTYVALDSKGHVYVADSMNFRVQVFDADGRFLRTGGEQGDHPGTFSRLKGLAFDGFDNLYAVDAEHASVQIFNRSFDLLMYFGGPAPFVEMMDLPSAIAVDRRTNRIYVCMEGTPRVNVYELVNTRAEDSAAPQPAAPAPEAPAREAGAAPASASR